MLSGQVNGKILVYAPSSPDGSSLRAVRAATDKIAKILRLEVEFIDRRDLKSVHVYYESVEGELIPVYFDYGRDKHEKEVYESVRNMMFVLSFHPKFSSLKPIRKVVIEPS